MEIIYLYSNFQKNIFLIGQNSLFEIPLFQLFKISWKIIIQFMKFGMQSTGKCNKKN